MKMVLRIFVGALALASAPPAAHAQVAGSLDPAFNPNVPPLADDLDPYTVRATAVQPDGKIIIAGNFGTVGGQSLGGVARLHPNGTVESTATFSGVNPVGGGISIGSGIYSMALQPDGKILLAGNGTTGRLGRINAAGTVESTETFNPGTGPNSAVYGMALQADGKILLGGAFTTVNGQTRNRIARLNADGSVESTATFNPGTGANDIVYSVALQPDGKILLGGDFTSVNGQARNRIARLHADGTLESTATFNPGTGANSTVFCVTVQADGKILCGGFFTSLNGQARNRIARLNADGTMESTGTFNPGTGANGSVSSVALQADGEILLAGNFSTVNGQARNRIARLSADGSVESTATFNPGTGAGGSLPSVDGVALQADGKILLGGRFATMNGQPRSKIARLLNDAATQSLTAPDNGRVQWMRGGAAPEVEQVTFESSTDGGANWDPLGPGTRIAGGWERTGLSLPPNSSLRARGRTAGGNYNGTSGLAEQVATFVANLLPEITVEGPGGANLADEASVSFPAVPGANVSRTFTIRNSGYADLTGLGITIDGPNAALFTVTANPTAPVAGPTGSTTFTVRFAHVGAGPKTATLHIVSNDADENPFDLMLLGRDPFTDANLADLVLSAGTLTPAFAAATTGYTASVAYSITSLTVSPTVADANATVQVNGVTIPSGSASGAIALGEGSNLLTVAVTADDGVTTKPYTVSVTRAAGAPGELDASFHPAVNGTIQATAVQPDGKIVIVDTFSTVSGQTRNGIARLNADGSVESTATFNAGTGANFSVSCAVVQADGKILLGGQFTTFNGQPRSQLVRLHANGALESTATFNAGSGTNASLRSMAVQTDGRILLVGDFTSVNGQPRNRIARLNANGTVESTATFNAGTGVSGHVSSVAVQADGKILLGGLFTSVGGQVRNNLVRLNPNGTVEGTATFNPGTGPDNEVWNVAVQPDGKILIGGFFLNVNGQARSRIARLNTNGTVESMATFNPGTGLNDFLNCIAVQADGKILLGGAFTSVNGQPRNRIARLHADGALESTATFDVGTGANNNVWSVAAQADGKILLAGPFTSVNGQARDYLARLNNDAATQSLSSPNGAQVQWTRGGAAPELQQVTFELSTDGGVGWTPLGSGTRFANGWERNGLTLPATGSIRARGRTTAGLYIGSSGLVEQIAAFTVTHAPEIVVEQPAGANLMDGASVAFVAALGASTSRTFTIKNQGDADLTGLGITVDGPDAALFTVTASPTAPVAGPNGSTTFSVRFAHTSAGPRTATLHIASNDADENPYDLTLNGRELSTNADLSNLALSAGTLTPTFTPATADYAASVAFSAASLSVIPTRADANASVQVDGVAVPSGLASGAIGLSVGSTLLTIAVTAEDGVTTKTYTVNVTRSAPGPGAVDQDFNLNVVGLRVRATAVQPDGKTLVVGTFSNIGGQARDNIARLNADGTVESTATFNPGTGASDDVTCVTVQPDGKILIGGWFLNVNGQAHTRIARLLPDGSVESTATFDAGTGADSGVESFAVQPDGKILIGGFFTSVNGQPRNSVARLHADGTLESNATFDPGTGANGAVRSVVVQADGKILLGGWFTSVNGQTRNYLARLHADGTLESTATFNPGTGASFLVNCLAVQADGRILVGGEFATFNGQPRNRIARLLADGTLESAATFNLDTGAENGFYGVQSLAVQADGKILLGGDFNAVSGQPRGGIARLHPDGSVEDTATFDLGTGVGGTVYSVALQADGRILLGGEFTAVNGQPRNRIARLINDAAIQTLTISNNTRVEWTRGGAAPEVEPVTFELSTNGGASWSALGAGVRIPSGWERTGLILPASGSIRARGRATAGSWNGSSGLVEQIAGFTRLTRLESWRLAYFGSPANSGPGADGNDYDHDGSVNVLEFATHRDPTRLGGEIGALSIDGTVLEFRYRRATAAVLDGLTFAVEWSDTLDPGSWSSVDVRESMPIDDGTVQEILATVPAGAADLRFVRLRVDAL